MTLAAAFLAAALFVPSMPPPEHDDCEAVTNCVFDASRSDAKMFSMRIELDAAPLSGVEVVFGRDADGDLALKAGTMQGFNYTARDAPVLDLTDKTVTFDEGATTNVVVKITATLTG